MIIHQDMVTVVCDWCQSQRTTITSTYNTRLDDQLIRAECHDRGWEVIGQGVFCPDCLSDDLDGPCIRREYGKARP